MTNFRWLAIVCGLIVPPHVPMQFDAQAMKTIKKKKLVHLDPDDTRTHAQQLFDRRVDEQKFLLDTGMLGTRQHINTLRPLSDKMSATGGDYRQDPVSNFIKLEKSVSGGIIQSHPMKEGHTFGRNFEEVNDIPGRDLRIARVSLMDGGHTYLLDATTGEEVAGPFWFGGYLPNKEVIEKLSQFFQDTISNFSKNGLTSNANANGNGNGFGNGLGMASDMFDISKFPLPKVDADALGDFTKLMTMAWTPTQIKEFYTGKWLGLPKFEDTLFKPYTGLTIVEREDGSGKSAWIFPLLSLTPTRVDLRTGHEKPAPQMPWMSIWQKKKVMPLEWANRQ